MEKHCQGENNNNVNDYNMIEKLVDEITASHSEIKQAISSFGRKNGIRVRKLNDIMKRIKQTKQKKSLDGMDPDRENKSSNVTNKETNVFSLNPPFNARSRNMGPFSTSFYTSSGTSTNTSSSMSSNTGSSFSTFHFSFGTPTISSFDQFPENIPGISTE
jgi:hypothetical protein